MNESRRSNHSLELVRDDDEDSVARLIGAAGPPPPAPELEIARLQEAARSVWRQRYAARRHARRALAWRVAAAAAIAAVAVGILWRRGATSPAPPGLAPVLAGVERAAGAAVRPSLAAGERSPLSVGAGLAAGTVVSTSATMPSFVALRWSDGRSLRLAAGSELVVAARDLVELRRGAVYVDSRGATTPRGPTVATPLGHFRELGTQFEVRLAPEGTAVRLRVREGEVAWRDDGRTATATAGVELALGADGSLSRAPVATHGADWDWVLAAAPTPAIEGWTVESCLRWYARESGLEVGWADEESRELAARVVVRGSLARLAPADAMAAVLASSGFALRVEGDALIATAHSGGAP